MTGWDPSGKWTLAELTNTVEIQGQKASSSTISTQRAVTNVFRVLYSAAVMLNLAAVNLQQSHILSAALAAPYQYIMIKKFRSHRTITPAYLNAIRRIPGFVANAGARSFAASQLSIRTAGVINVQVKPNGFPDFSNYIHPTSGVVFIRLTGKRRSDYALANAVRMFPKPKGYTWHHHEVMGIMELVRTDAHRAFGHSGGVFFWQIANQKNYP